MSDKEIMPTVPFTMQMQQGGNLCWAAVGVSVGLWRNPALNKKQCDVAQGVLPLAAGVNCCAHLSQCDQDGPLGAALQFCHVNINVPQFRALTVLQIQNQINAGKVICVGIQWRGGGLHYVVIAGYENDAANTLHIRDPYFNSSDVPYNVFVSNYKHLGSWEETITLQ